MLAPSTETMVKIKPFGFVGSSPDARYIAMNRTIAVTHGNRRVSLVCDRKVTPEAKVAVAELPSALLAAGESLGLGGGVYNSWCAFQSIAPDACKRFLDTCTIEC